MSAATKKPRSLDYNWKFVAGQRIECSAAATRTSSQARDDDAQPSDTENDTPTPTKDAAEKSAKDKADDMEADDFAFKCFLVQNGFDPRTLSAEMIACLRLAYAATRAMQGDASGLTASEVNLLFGIDDEEAIHRLDAAGKLDQVMEDGLIRADRIAELWAILQEDEMVITCGMTGEESEMLDDGVAGLGKLAVERIKQQTRVEAIEKIRARAGMLNF